MLTPAEAYDLTREWVQLNAHGEPTGVFQALHANDARPYSATHRIACLEYIHALREDAHTDDERSKLDHLLAFYTASPLRPPYKEPPCNEVGLL